MTSLVSLSSLIQAYPEHYLGSILQKWPHARDVPFLFKILSIGKALPLQAHPDKDLGAALNKRNPTEFVDANHKPEIAVAIAGEVDPIGANYAENGPIAFTGFCGFRPLERIAHSLRNVRELREAVADDEAVNAFLASPTKEGLKKVYGALLTNGKEHPERVKELVEKLVDRVTSAGIGQAADEETIVLSRLVNKVNEQYKGDVGVFSVPFFMNFVRLRRGEVSCSFL
jgi:mannose-6-phosphate isomerase